MPDHNPTPELVTGHPERIHGYDYGTDRAAASPLTLEELERLKDVVGLTEEDQHALREAAEIPRGTLASAPNDALIVRDDDMV